MKRVGGMTGAQMADVFAHWNTTENLPPIWWRSRKCVCAPKIEDGADLVEKIQDKAVRKERALDCGECSGWGFCPNDLCRTQWSRDELHEGSTHQGGIDPSGPVSSPLTWAQAPMAWLPRWMPWFGLHGQLCPGHGTAAHRVCGRLQPAHAFDRADLEGRCIIRARLLQRIQMLSTPILSSPTY